MPIPTKKDEQTVLDLIKLGIAGFAAILMVVVVVVLTLNTIAFFINSLPIDL